ncbi:MAG: hypothetical protein L6367_03840 [Cellulomonas sp.]|nr:hypothetical protein [Cellulomonas sp.]
MRTTSKLTMTGLVGALAAALVLSAGPASADPPATTYPTLAGTGSDTTQFVLDGLSAAILVNGNRVIGSYDALDPATSQPGGLIQTTAGGVQFNRPNGSGAGAKALTASINPTGTYTQGQTVNGVTTQVSIDDQLDFARSSSGPSVAGSDLTFIPFARDAVGYAYANVGTASVPSNLTTADLQNIYKGILTSYTGADNLTHSYVPRLPQANSGTRAFFLKALGLTESQVSWISNLVQENDGSEIDAVGEIVPFSVASWIAQDNLVVANTIRTTPGGSNPVALGSIGGVAPIVNDVLNTSFPYTRLVYNVVETSRLSATDDESVLLQDVFAGPTSAVCDQAGVITTYGFGTLGALCGNTTDYLSGYVTP